MNKKPFHSQSEFTLTAHYNLVAKLIIISSFEKNIIKVIHINHFNINTAPELSPKTPVTI
ncbi:hypothetical protein C9I90_04705 [Photobacterium aphoticum]|uniref:Uncharacterized protein n=1 Tax=Photobacterium aphoticum TaxID=754436 RepID=A0A0J1GI24_9GAMM|nr:hypothetical protein ABT58_19280 [Photobacterium aphoticum]PSU59059.1 hypothetical protein C9I90_04705 [Photobacterium aphoticum]